MRSAVVAFAFTLTGFFAGAVFFIAASLVLAWTGPTSAPPNGNVAAPINVGTTDQIKNAGLAINSLAVFGNAILAGVSSYLNFGNTSGSSGYGIRDNAGILEFKNTNGSWATLANTGGSSGTVSGGCSGDGTSWGNASNCTARTCSTGQAVGTCPAGYTARRIGATSGVACTGGYSADCSCGSVTGNFPTWSVSYNPSYYTAPTLCIRD